MPGNEARQYFVYNELSGNSRCQVEVGGDSEEEGPSKNMCKQKVAGKFPTNLKRHLEKYHVVQYQEILQGKEDAKKSRVRAKDQKMKGVLPKGQATLQQTLAGKSAYGKNSNRYHFITMQYLLEVRMYPSV